MSRFPHPTSKQGFLILDKLPSLRLGRYCLLSRSLGLRSDQGPFVPNAKLRARKASKIGDGKFGDVDEKDVSSQFLSIGRASARRWLSERGSSEYLGVT